MILLKVKILKKMEVHCLVKHNGNQLELQNDIVANLMDKLSQFDYVAVVCILGEPSSAKTSIMNAIIKHFRVNCGLTGSGNCDGFPQPRKAQNDGQRFDGILLSTPPFTFCDNLGGCVAVMLLDLWNNDTMSEDVYGKLLDFCFQVSSVKVFSLCSPLRQVPWWNGGFEASSCSPELKQAYSHLKRASTLKQDEHNKNNTRSSSAVIAVQMCSKDEAEYFPVLIHGDEAENAVYQYEDCFNFILQQIVGACNHGRCCKPSEFKDHLTRCVTNVNSAARGPSCAAVSQPHLNAQSVAVNTESAARNQHILQSYKTRLLQVYSQSTQLFLSNQELTDYSIALLDELGIGPEEVFKSCESHFNQLTRFHNGVESSLKIISTEVEKHLGETLSICEQVLASSFKKYLEGYEILRDLQHNQGNVNVTATVENIAVQVFTTLKMSACPLEDELRILSLKLKHRIRQKLSQNLEALQIQLELIIQTYGVYKSKLNEIIQGSMCLSGEEFEKAAELAWNAMESREDGIEIRPLLIRVRDAAVQEHEDKLREQNEQLFNSEMCLAKKATTVAADFVLRLLTEYIQKFGVITDSEVKRAFQAASEHAKKAFLSAPGFNKSPPWHAAVQSLPKVFENFYSEVRQINLNATRRWDRALESALRKSAEFYSQQMDHKLPEYKISPKELEKLHEASAERTVSEFTVAAEVNEPTKKHWKKLLTKNQLQEWKEGYVCVNDEKEHVHEAQKSLFSEVVKKADFSDKVKKTALSQDRPKMTGRNTPPPQLQSLNSPASNVGVYFGPEIVIFTASYADGDEVQVPISPFAVCSNSILLWGEEALQVARNTEQQLFDIFAILTKPTVLVEQPGTTEFSGESVCLTSEALAVLFFKHAVTQIIVQTGCGIGSCAVALPGLLSSAAKTAVKEAIRLAGFSKVTLVPFTTAMAMPLALSLKTEHWEKNSRKVVALYHAGKLLEAALLHVSPENIEVKKLVGYVNMSALNESSLTSLTRKQVEKVATRDLFATLTLVGDVSMSDVEDGLNKATSEMDSLKYFGIRYGHKQNGSKKSMNATEISSTMAKLDACSSSTANRDDREVPFPAFSYYEVYDIELPTKGFTKPKKCIHQYFHRTGTSHFHIHEGAEKRHWKYVFELNAHSPSGTACNLVFLEDGSFRISPPAHNAGIPVHSSSCKLLTFWDQEIVKQNVERVIKLMGMKDTKTSATVEMNKEEATEVQKAENVKFSLSQLVCQVEDVLKISGHRQGPVYDFINDSLQECRQLLQNPNSTEQNLKVTMRKLEIRSSDLLQK